MFLAYKLIDTQRYCDATSEVHLIHSVHAQRERDPLSLIPLAPFNGRFMIIKLGLDARGAKTNGPRTAAAAAAEEKFSAKHISSAPRCDSVRERRGGRRYICLDTARGGHTSGGSML